MTYIISMSALKLLNDRKQKTLIGIEDIVGTYYTYISSNCY